MRVRDTVMGMAAALLLTAQAYAADTYFTDIGTGGDMDGYAFNVVKAPSVAAALTALLGKDYKALTRRVETAGPVERHGDITCGSGLMAHHGGVDEAIFCLDHATGKAQAGIMADTKITFHTGGALPYDQLAAWKDRILKQRVR